MLQPVNDLYIKMEWYCDECGDRITVCPDYYQDNGTPVCIECDCDMLYGRTLVDMYKAYQETGIL